MQKALIETQKDWICVRYVRFVLLDQIVLLSRIFSMNRLTCRQSLLPVVPLNVFGLSYLYLIF